MTSMSDRKPDPAGPFGPGHPDTVDGECYGFAWIGQPFTSCETCGKPYWEHRFDARLDRDGSHGGGWWRRPITEGEAAAVRAKWDSQPASMRRVVDVEDDDKPVKRMVTFDPDDPEVLKLVTLSLYPAFISHPGFADHAAHAVLSALRQR